MRTVGEGSERVGRGGLGVVALSVVLLQRQCGSIIACLTSQKWKFSTTKNISWHSLAACRVSVCKDQGADFDILMFYMISHDTSNSFFFPTAENYQLFCTWAVIILVSGKRITQLNFILNHNVI